MTDTTAKPLPAKVATTEYVVGSSSVWGARGLRSLVWAFDDLTAELGDDLYAQMLHDPTTRAVNNIIISSVIEEGMSLTPALSDPAADGYDLSQEIAGFCTSVLNDLETPLDDVLWDMCGAIALGSRVAELAWQQRNAASYYVLDSTAPVGGSLLTLRAIKVKPRRATAFVVDAYMNIIGLLGAQASGGMTNLVGGAVLVDNPANILPREKFFIYSFRPKDGDPRGTSVLRPAYTPWQLKRNLYPEFFKFLAQFASPSIWGSAAEGAPDVRVEMADGSIELKNAVVALQEALIAYQNGSALAVPYGTLVSVLQSAPGGDAAFHNAFTHCDTQIALAVLNETLATLEAKHQSRASSTVHQDTQQTVVRQIKRGIAGAFRRDVLCPMVRYNYGDKAAALLTPVTSLGSVEQNDLASMMTAVAQLARASYFDVSQLPGVDALLNLPPRQNVEPIEQPVTTDPNAPDDPNADPAPNDAPQQEPLP